MADGKGGAEETKLNEIKDDNKKLMYNFPKPEIEFWDIHKYRDAFKKVFNEEFLPTINADKGNPTDNLMMLEKWLYKAVMSLPEMKEKKNYKSNIDLIKDAYIARNRIVGKPAFSINEGIEYWMGIASDDEFNTEKDYELIHPDAKIGKTGFSRGLMDRLLLFNDDNFCESVISNPNRNFDMYGVSTYLIMFFDTLRVFVLNQFKRLGEFTGELNPAWTSGNIFFKYKKGDTGNPANFRPLVAQPTVVKMYHKAIGKFMYDYMVEGGYLDNTIQKGLCGIGNSVFENTQHAKLMMKDAHEKERSLCCAMLDIKQAYGSITYPFMKYCLEKYGFDEVLVNYVMKYYYEMKVKIIHDGKLSDDEFSWNKGLLQGDNLANVMFLICLNSILAKVQNEFGELGYGIKNEKTGTVEKCLMLAYVDDLLIFTENMSALNVVCNVFNTNLNKVGMKLNLGKCQWLENIYVHSYEKDLYIGGNTIYRLKSGEFFKYLGSDMTLNGDDNATLGNYLKWLEGEFDYIDSIRIKKNYAKSDGKFNLLTPHMKLYLYRTFVFKRTMWDFSRTIWAESSIKAIEDLEEKRIEEWFGTRACGVGCIISKFKHTRLNKSYLVRERRMLESTHSMMRMLANMEYSYDTGTSDMKKRIEKLTELTDKIDDKFNSSFATCYDEMETF